ncbi:outer membrane beta-barrel protein [Vibrio sp. CAU 1672]|uniref:outer membrane beta-barrel protein n=1 Tax=Vibrio sp. CAU 1672 TaxID=3032594 RepID=UPI0023DC9B30|nr:outer membrane beta-barrel protein [Vibrio sp. CAU 1672]MDF2155300.1 outer membrane beta-barrel protein [Vibrio sp. CAU 1672]
MKTTSKIATTLFLLTLSNGTFSNEHRESESGYNDIYFGLGGAFATIDADGTYYNAADDTILTASANIDDNILIGGFVGYRFNPWASLEARAYFNAHDGEFFGVPIEISRYFGLFARPTLPIHDNFSLYGLLGYGSVTAKALGVSETESDLAYGLGMEVGNGNKVKLQVEWMLFHDESYGFTESNGDRYNAKLEASSVNMNLAWYFN